MNEQRSTRRRHLVIAAALSTLTGWAVAQVAAEVPGVTKVPDYGIDLLDVRLAASDFLIDLRYRVKDAAKAKQLLDKNIRPVLVNETTGERYYVPQAPKVGPLRQSATAKQPVQVDKVYFILFANPERKLRVGEKVTLYAGDSIVEGLEVR